LIDEEVKFNPQESPSQNIKRAWDSFAKMGIDTFMDVEDVAKEQIKIEINSQYKPRVKREFVSQRFKREDMYANR